MIITFIIIIIVIIIPSDEARALFASAIKPGMKSAPRV